MTTPPEIVLSADGRFAVGAWMTIWSAARTWGGAVPPRFHLLTRPETEAPIRHLRNLAESQRISVTIHPVDMAAVEGLPHYHYNEFSYLRVLAPRLVPATGELLYLDSDLLIRRSIHSLFGSTTRHPVAAVREYGCIDLADGFRYLTFPEDEARRDYFNAGLLLINVPAWNERLLSEQMLEFLHAHKDRLHHGDQDAVNSVLRGDVERLDETWNFQSEAFPWLDSVGWPPQRAELAARRRELENDAAVVHFIGAAKPWDKHLASHYAAEYRRGLFASGWIPAAGAPWAALQWTLRAWVARARGVKARLRRVAA